jgi:hypothetical protein
MLIMEFTNPNHSDNVLHYVKIKIKFILNANMIFTYH